MMRLLRGTGFVILGMAIAVLGRRAVRSESYWFDESGQYWMSLGQTHFAPPGTHPGGLSDILAANAAANLDPGGFTLLLRLWLEVFPVALLRLLPLFFGLLVVVLSVMLVRTVTDSATGVAALAASLVLLSPLLQEYSFELRAYTMEAASTLLAALLVVLPVQFWTKWSRTAFAGLALGLLATSRYSALVPAALAVAMIGLDPRIALSKRFALSALVAPAGAFSVWMLRLQNPSARPPNYVDSYIATTPRAVLESVLDSESLWLFLALAAVALLAIRGDGQHKVTWANPPFRFSVFAVAVVAAFAVLSLVGYYPFGTRTRWDITIQILLHATVAVLATSVLRSARIEDGRLLRAFTAVLVATGLVVGFTPAVKERMVAAVLACYDASAPFVLNEGALPTYRLHQEVLGTLEVLGSSTPQFYTEYSTNEDNSPTHLVDRSDIPAHAQILLNFHQADDLKELMQTREACFGDAKSTVVFLTPGTESATSLD